MGERGIRDLICGSGVFGLVLGAVSKLSVGALVMKKESQRAQCWCVGVRGLGSRHPPTERCGPELEIRVCYRIESLFVVSYLVSS